VGVVMVGVDGSTRAAAASEWAARLAVIRRARLVVASAWQSDQAEGTKEDVARRRTETQALLEGPWCDPARAAGAVPRPLLLDGTPDVLLEAAAAEQADLIVVGNRGVGGFAALHLGSVAHHLARHTTLPLAIVPSPAAGSGPKTIVVGVDGSPSSDAAIGFAFAEADWRAADVLAIHAVDGPQFTGPSDALIYDRRSEEARAVGLLYRATAEWHEQFPDLLVQRRVRWAPPAETLVKASTSAQLVVVGRRGGGGFLGLRLGSVVQALLHHAACPVAVVPDVA